MADDKGATVRLAVARHPAAPQHGLTLLAEQPTEMWQADEDLLLELLARPDCPEAAPWRAAKAWPEVQAVAALHPKLPSQLRPSLTAAGQRAERFVLGAARLLVSNSLGEDERFHLAWMTSDWAVLDRLSRDVSPRVRRVTAANLSTPAPRWPRWPPIPTRASAAMSPPTPAPAARRGTRLRTTWPSCGNEAGCSVRSLPHGT